MKVAIITDTHYGARKNSKLFHDYFEKFYNEIFFPKLEEEGITTVIHMGDCFDSRKGVDFTALAWAKRVVFDPLKERGITMHLMAGNHDCYYKNTNSVTSVDLLLSEYENVKVYTEATQVNVEGRDILFIPWINSENEQDALSKIKNSSSECAMGHLELKGFRAHRGCIMEDGLDGSFFEKFRVVYSGHFHTRSDDSRIFYLGNPYEMFANDVLDKRGFHIFETETLQKTEVNNPYRMFYNIYFEDSDYQLLDTSELSNKIVKVIVRKKTDAQKFEKFIDKIFSAGPAEMKVVENFQLIEAEDFEAEESEDTMSILARYVSESETELDKGVIQNLIREVYQEACEVI